MNEWDQSMDGISQEGTSANNALADHERALFKGLRNRKKAKNPADDIKLGTLRYLFTIFH